MRNCSIRVGVKVVINLIIFEGFPQENQINLGKEELHFVKQFKIFAFH